MACNYNQNQSCTNLCCTGKDCLQHPYNRIKILYKSIRDMYGACKPKDEHEKGQEYTKRQVLNIIEKEFPEVNK